MSSQQPTLYKPYAVYIVGPPGAGKSTLCHALHQYLNTIPVDHSLYNLDPANEGLNYPCDFDIRSVLTVEQVMREERLGPNGALLRCFELLSTDSIPAVRPGKRVVFMDLPGQVELFTHCPLLPRLISSLKIRFTSAILVNVVDITGCTDPFRYLSTLLIALKTTLFLGLPTINIFSKVDLFASFTSLSNVCNVDHLQDLQLDNLGNALAELVQDYSILSFIPIAVEDRRCMEFVWREIEVTTGMIFEGADMWGAARTERTMEEYMQEMEEKYSRAYTLEETQGNDNDIGG